MKRILIASALLLAPMQAADAADTKLRTITTKSTIPCKVKPNRIITVPVGQTCSTLLKNHFGGVNRRFKKYNGYICSDPIGGRKVCGPV